ncbi:MAG: YnbE family lipoprotein [Sphingomicrobium sp.]
MTTTDLRRPAALARTVLSVSLGLGLAGCISVKTPEKPIEINLNVNIKQEVLVRLQRDVEQLINQNPQAFPQTPPPGTKP